MPPITIHLSGLIPWIILIFFVISIIETIHLIRSDGRPRRGFIIWKRLLSTEEKKYLLGLHNDVVVYWPVVLFRSAARQGFIHIEKNEALIYFRTPRWRTGWPYVGFVNLSFPEPFLEYRVSFFSHLLILFFIFIGIVFKIWPILLVAGGLIYLNFSVETKAIDNFLIRQAKGSNKLQER
jgi:hypothetical protein